VDAPPVVEPPVVGEGSPVVESFGFSPFTSRQQPLRSPGSGSAVKDLFVT
jgi:hypothetical protein